MKWFQGSIPEAIQSSKANKSVFIVYVYGEDELSQQMSITWEDDQVTKICETNNAVAVKIAGNSEACGFFSQIYPVIVVPSSFFIGEGGVPLEVTGGHSEPAEFMKKIERVLQDHKRQLQNAVGDSAQVALPVSGASNSKTSAETKEELASSSDSQDLSDKVEKAKRLIEEERKKKVKQEEEKAHQAEKERRQLGQELQQLRENQKEQELKELQEQLKKEKQEERKAKERVREQIAKDRSIEEVLSSYPVRERVKTKRHELTIKEKIELLKVSEGKSLRQLANMFGIGKSQVCGLLKRKDEILGLIGTVMMDSNRKRRSFGNRDTAEINTLTLEWYQRARLANLTVSGPMLQQKAKEFAKILGKEDFKASNGWLDSFKRRHNIMSTKACSESLNSSVSSTSQDEDPVVYPETGDDQDSNEPDANEFSFLPNFYGTNYHSVTEGEGEANASGASTSTLSQSVLPQPESDQRTDGAKIYAQALLKTAESILNQHFQMEVKKEPIDPDEETSEDSSGSNGASEEQFSTQTTELSVHTFSMHESDTADQNLFQNLRPSTLSDDSQTKASKNIYLPPLLRPSSFDSDKKDSTQELNDNDNDSEEGVASGLSANPFVALSGNDRFVYNPEAFSQSVCRDSEDDEINSDSEPNRIEGFELRRSIKRKVDDQTPKEESIVSGCHSYEYSTNQLDTLAEVSSKRPKLSYDSVKEQNTELNSQFGNTDESKEKDSSDDNISSFPGISFQKFKKDLPRFFYKYAAKDVYVLVSTELMTHALPDKTLIGTKVKRLRVTFLCNLEGLCFRPFVTCTRDDFSLHQVMKNRSQDIFPVHLSFGHAKAESNLYVNEVVGEADKVLKDHGRHVFLFLEEGLGKCIHQNPQNIDIVLCSEAQTSVHSVVTWITYNFKLAYRKKLLRALLTHGCISLTSSAAELCEKVSIIDVSMWIREACENLNFKLGNLSLDKEVFLCKSLKEDSEFNNLVTMISKFLCFSQPMSVEEYIVLEGPDITSPVSKTETAFAVVHKELTQIQSIGGQGINNQKEAYRAVQELKMFCAEQNLLDVLQNLESAEESLQKCIISGILS